MNLCLGTIRRQKYVPDSIVYVFMLKEVFIIKIYSIKGSVWESDKLILNDGRWFPETADVIFFSEKFVF